jgi:hypothetical protein
VINSYFFCSTIFQNRAGESEFCPLFYHDSITRKGIIRSESEIFIKKFSPNRQLLIAAKPLQEIIVRILAKVKKTVYLAEDIVSLFKMSELNKL